MFDYRQVSLRTPMALESNSWLASNNSANRDHTGVVKTRDEQLGQVTQQHTGTQNFVGGGEDVVTQSQQRGLLKIPSSVGKCSMFTQTEHTNRTYTLYPCALPPPRGLTPSTLVPFLLPEDLHPLPSCPSSSPRTYTLYPRALPLPLALNLLPRTYTFYPRVLPPPLASFLLPSRPSSSSRTYILYPCALPLPLALTPSTLVSFLLPRTYTLYPRVLPPP
uniref:Uncharacterized protein n=1 Tax=Timema douglasi TaxID=61478 RepID=A0A7R8VG51_TIMDO|nr:unnamed protein product [Timema douglasi]